MAHHYTDNDSKFMFLFHKLTVHDIGVSETGKLRVKNSDDIMIVDRSDIRNRSMTLIYTHLKSVPISA